MGFLLLLIESGTACVVLFLHYNTRLYRCEEIVCGGFDPTPTNPDLSKMAKRNNNNPKIAKKDPVCVDGVRPRPMFVDYKDLDLLSKLTNRHGKIVGRRKTGCQAVSQHAVSKAVKRARFMALLPYKGA
jgi:small subunit ribosomal protein S18